MKLNTEYNINLVIDATQKMLLQYRDQPQFKAWVLALVERCEAVKRCILDMLKICDIDNAAGDQLEIIGELVGASRIFRGRSLADSEYRLLIRAKIAVNNCDGTLDGVLDALTFMFNGKAYYIWEPSGTTMTLGLLTTGLFTQFENELFFSEKIFPKPSGVRISPVNNVPDGRIFAADDSIMFNGLTKGGFDDDLVNTPAPFFD